MLSKDIYKVRMEQSLSEKSLKRKLKKSRQLVDCMKQIQYDSKELQIIQNSKKNRNIKIES